MQCVFLCLTTLVLSTDAYAVCLIVPYYVSTLVLSTDAYAVCLFLPHYLSTLVLSTAAYPVCPLCLSMLVL